MSQLATRLDRDGGAGAVVAAAGAGSVVPAYVPGVDDVGAGLREPPPRAFHQRPWRRLRHPATRGLRATRRSRRSSCAPSAGRSSVSPGSHSRHLRRRVQRLSGHGSRRRPEWGGAASRRRRTCALAHRVRVRRGVGYGLGRLVSWPTGCFDPAVELWPGQSHGIWLTTAYCR
jgi:hypothetical protein